MLYRWFGVIIAYSVSSTFVLSEMRLCLQRSYSHFLAFFVVRWLVDPSTVVKSDRILVPLIALLFVVVDLAS